MHHDVKSAAPAPQTPKSWAGQGCLPGAIAATGRNVRHAGEEANP